MTTPPDFNPSSHPDKQNPFVVHEAIKHDPPEAIEFYKGCDLDLLNSAGDTPLHSAVTLNKPGWIEALLENGANPSVPNRGGVLPQALAETLKKQECVDAFNTGQALAESTVLEESMLLSESWVDIAPFPIHEAVAQNSMDYRIVQLHLGHIDAVNEDGDAPIHIAARKGHLDWLEFLIKSKARLDEKVYILAKESPLKSRMLKILPKQKDKPPSYDYGSQITFQ